MFNTITTAKHTIFTYGIFKSDGDMSMIKCNTNLGEPVFYNSYGNAFNIDGRFYMDNCIAGSYIFHAYGEKGSGINGEFTITNCTANNYSGNTQSGIYIYGPGNGTDEFYVRGKVQIDNNSSKGDGFIFLSRRVAFTADVNIFNNTNTNNYDLFAINGNVTFDGTTRIYKNNFKAGVKGTMKNLVTYRNTTAKLAFRGTTSIIENDVSTYLFYSAYENSRLDFEGKTEFSNNNVGNTMIYFTVASDVITTKGNTTFANNTLKNCLINTYGSFSFDGTTDFIDNKFYASTFFVVQSTCTTACRFGRGTTSFIRNTSLLNSDTHYLFFNYNAAANLQLDDGATVYMTENKTIRNSTSNTTNNSIFFLNSSAKILDLQGDAKLHIINNYMEATVNFNNTFKSGALCFSNANQYISIGSGSIIVSGNQAIGAQASLKQNHLYGVVAYRTDGLIVEKDGCKIDLQIQK